MGTKLIFRCNSCGATGTIKVNEPEYEISVCPCCGNSLDIESDEDEDEYYEN